ncbi:MAG: hypothetical protein ACD_8C00026G0001 [uncultured bacterium]|nr:MAG: hypothetical protein ACD_8C00026G0001 [uncultured bacterium]
MFNREELATKIGNASNNLKIEESFENIIYPENNSRKDVCLIRKEIRITHGKNFITFAILYFAWSDGNQTFFKEIHFSENNEFFHVSWSLTDDSVFISFANKSDDEPWIKREVGYAYSLKKMMQT